MQTVKFRGFLSMKPGFWFFQIIGWSLFMLLDFFNFYKEISELPSPVFWILSFLVGFCISLLLRQWYKHVYYVKRSIFQTVNIFLISSFAAAILWYLIRATILTPIQRMIFEGSEFAVVTGNLYNIVTRIVSFTWPFFIWSILYFGIKFWLDLISEQERSEKAALLAQKSQLQMLRYQLNPHFLFNSLNSIQALVYDDPGHADRMITQLSDFLRYTIRDKDKLFIPLKEEVVIVEKYLSMEKTRFPDRLSFEINVTREASEVEVLAFILQPFVENAVKYGMRTSPYSLNIIVNCYTRNESLILEVINNGKWFESDYEGRIKLIPKHL